MFQIPGLCKNFVEINIPGTTWDQFQGNATAKKILCDDMVGYLSVYRICFAMTAFFFLMSLIMIAVKSSKDPRAGIQNGFVYNGKNLETSLNNEIFFFDWAR